MKKVSFIRWQGFVAFVIISAAVYLFTTLYMDSLLKKLIEKNATYYNGALVEIDSLKLSFLTSSLNIKGLKVTNPDDLMQNRVEIDNMLFDFRFLPLLKKKFVTEEINVTGVSWLTKRKREGKIPDHWKKQWEREDKEGSTISAKISEAFGELKDSVKAQLPDISVDTLKKKFDPRTIKIEELSSYQKVTSIRENAKDAYGRFESSTKKLVADQKEFISDARKKVDSLDPRKLKTPQSILNAINTLNSFQGDIKKQKGLINSNLYEVSSQTKSLTSSLKDVPKLIKDDTQSIVDKYSFGSFNMDNFSRQIFGGKWIEHFRKYSQLTAQAKAYQRKLRTGKNDKPKKERAAGITVAFPITDGLPRFLIEKINMSAKTGKKASANEVYRGEYFLKVEDISSNQKLWGKPTEAVASLDTYDGAFAKASASLLLDYREEPAKDKLKLEIQKYKLAGTTLGKSTAFPLPLSDGFANAEVSGGSLNNEIKFNATLNIAGAKYNFEKSSNYIVELLQNIVDKIRDFRVNIELSGTVRKPRLKITSTLDKAIANGINKVFAEKLSEIRTKAEKYIREQISSNIDKARAQVDQLKAKVEVPLQDQSKKMDSLSSEAKKRIEELKKKQKSLAGSKLKGLFN